MRHTSIGPTGPAFTLSIHSQKFSPGHIVSTPAALEAMEAAGCLPIRLLARHLSGDWGLVCPDDAALNDAALLAGDRLLSVYEIAPEVRIWVITEADRSATTLLLPEETSLSRLATSRFSSVYFRWAEHCEPKSTRAFGDITGLNKMETSHSWVSLVLSWTRVTPV